MEEKMKISEAELEVLQVLWDAEEPLKIQDVCDRLENKKWKYNTVGTLLLRMAEKGAVVSEKKNRIIYYRPVWEREAYQKEQTETLIDRLYHGSAKGTGGVLVPRGEHDQRGLGGHSENVRFVISEERRE